MSDETVPIYIAIGSNLGDRLANLARAVDALSHHYASVVQSPVYETDPRDVTDQPPFLNMVVRGSSGRSPEADLAALLAIENSLGRQRVGAVPRGPRTIDIDLLLHGIAVVQTDPLTLPHPRIRERQFVLVPLLAIEPQLRDPATGTPYRHYLAALPDQGIYYAYPAAYNGQPPYGGNSS